jgi:hypothetical protein
MIKLFSTCHVSYYFAALYYKGVKSKYSLGRVDLRLLSTEGCSTQAFWIDVSMMLNEMIWVYKESMKPIVLYNEAKL